MTVEEKVVSLFAEANPVPKLDLLDPIEPLDIHSLDDRSRRSRVMTEIKTVEPGAAARRSQQGLRRLVLTAVGVVVLVLGIGFLVSGQRQIAATPVDIATEFWMAVEAGDAGTALALVEPTAVDAGAANLFGRAHTLDGQFDWYRSVGWQWEFGTCDAVNETTVECTASAQNDWSEVLELEPVGATYVMEFNESGIVAIADKNDAFQEQWGVVAFTPFGEWVAANHPADADIMFDFEVDSNQEILDLYRVNSERFVEAHSNG